MRGWGGGGGGSERVGNGRLGGPYLRCSSLIVVVGIDGDVETVG